MEEERTNKKLIFERGRCAFGGAPLLVYSGILSLCNSRLLVKSQIQYALSSLSSLLNGKKILDFW